MKDTGKRVTFLRENCRLLRGAYSDGNRTALMLQCENGEPMAKCTVNLPDDHLGADEVAVKSYSENEGMVEALMAAGVIEKPYRSIQSGHVQIPVCRLLLD